MAFWSDTNLREPLRQNRWYITFQDSLIQNYVFALKECTKPEYKIETTSHVLLNHTFNYPKNLVWQPINIKMVSARDKLNTVASVLQARLDSNGYTTPSSLDDRQLSKELMSNNMGLSLYQVDANGARIEEWKLFNPMITSVNYGSLTYENDGFVEISFDIIYDSADLDISEGAIDFNIESTTASGSPGSVKNVYNKITEEQIADKILNRASQLNDTNGQIKSISSISPGFPGPKK